MTLSKRILIALVSAGWLVPLTLSFWAAYDFLWYFVWPTAAFGQSTKPMSPFHLVLWADELFYFSILWAGAVIIGWSIRLTSRD